MQSKHRLHLLAVPLLLGGALAGSGAAGAAPAGAAPAGKSNPCVVPRLTGTPLVVVKRLLPLLNCRTGIVIRRPSISIDKNSVITTRPTAGRYRSNTAVTLTISGGTPSDGPSTAAAGRGTNNDPYSGSCTEEVEGSCVVSFDRRLLRPGLVKSDYVPAYRCPASHPWLLKKTLTEGRILPAGVKFTADPDVAVNITGVSKKEGKTEKQGHKVYAFDYATGTLTGFPNSSVTNWGARDAYYRLSLYCTGDLTKAILVGVRG